MENTVIITGASGLVARHLVSYLLSNTDSEIVAISSNPGIVWKRHESSRLKSICYEEFFGASRSRYNNKHAQEKGFVHLVHCAFTRKNDAEEVKRSIDLAYQVFNKCVEFEIDGVLNLSSRSIYKEPAEGQLNTEDSELYLPGLIALGKYSVELLANSLLGRARIPYSNLRLASVNELKMDNNMIRPLNVFVENVIAGKPIRVIGGMQVMSFIDPRDVASAICSLLTLPPHQWQDKYNIGTGWLCTDTLLNMARLVVERGMLLGFKPVPINIEERVVNQHAGLDISRITADTGWNPKVNLTGMIDSLFKMKIAQ